MNSENVVVHGEHIESSLRSGFLRDGNLRVVDAGEVAGTGGLVLLGLEGEGIGVDTRSRGTSVMVESLHLVEVLTRLLLEAVLAVKNKLEGAHRTGDILSPSSGGSTGTELKGGCTHERGRHEAVGRRDSSDVGNDDGIIGGEVPKVGISHTTLVEAPDKLLDGVIVGQALLDGLTGCNTVGTGVLDLLDEVLMTLLGEAAALLGVEVHVVTPNLESAVVGVVTELRREVEVKADLVVLEGNEGEGKTGVAVEEEDEGEEHLGINTRGHLTPNGLLGLVEVKLRVQAPPALVVLVDALTTDGQLNILDGTLSGPAGSGAGKRTLRLEFDVHVGDEITVAGDGNRDTAVGTGGTVDGLLDVLHREVSVAAVNRLEEGNLGVTGKVNVLGAVSD